MENLPYIRGDSSDASPVDAEDSHGNTILTVSLPGAAGWVGGWKGRVRLILVQCRYVGCLSCFLLHLPVEPHQNVMSENSDKLLCGRGDI